MKIRLIHHLARTGGTLISRCLGCMDGVVLLSEINPRGVARISPERQAADWFDVIPANDVQQLKNGDLKSFVNSIKRVSRAVEASDRSLIIRDWTHIDFVGFPFNSAPTMQFELSDVLSSEFEVHSVFSARNPIDQYLSMKKLALLRSAWDEAQVWRGMRQFAERIQGKFWFRYEDFLDDPDQILRQVCEQWDLEFDATYREKWYEYQTITGDKPAKDRTTISPDNGREIPDSIWAALVGNPDVYSTFELLGYPLPAQMRNWKSATANSVAQKPDDILLAAEKRLANGEHAAARRLAEQILSVDSKHVQARIVLAESLLGLKEEESALETLTSLLSDQPDSIPALRAIIKCLRQLGRRFDTIPYQATLCQLCPDDLDNQFAFSTALTGIGAVNEAMTYCQHVLRSDPHNYGIATNYLLFTNYKDSLSASEIAKEHFRVAMRFSSKEDFKHRPPESTRRKIRIAYLSSDFCVHPVGKLFRGFVRGHDRTRFELFAYHDGEKSDALTKTVEENVDVFRTIHRWANEEVLQQIRDDEVDVLFDLGGFTAGGNRLSVFSRRAAPVQISFLGYPNTTALHTMDYRITDALADPPGLSDEFYSEQLIRLDCGHVAWEPYECLSEVEVIRNEGPLRIGSFNNVAKISDSALDCWAQILIRSPGSTLHLKYGDRFEEKLVRDRFFRLFAERGVLPSRLRFEPCCPTYKDHLTALQHVDLALDSIPYQGTMTSLETLSVGTPIVSLAGSYYAHRATSAMVERIGFPELVARSKDEYIEIACQLLSDPEGLRALKPEVRRRFHSSSLVDPAKFTQHLEAAVSEVVNLESCGLRTGV